MPGLVVADIITQFGDYYLGNNKENRDRLTQALRKRSFTPSVCTPIVCTDTLYRHALTQMSNVLQAFQKAFTPKGTLDFKPRTIEMGHPKIDTYLDPDNVEATWLGFLGALDKIERKDWPIVRYFMEMELMPQKEHEMESFVYYKGEYNAPTTGTAGNNSDTMNGLRKQLKDGLTAGRVRDLTPIMGGGFTASTVFDKVEAIVDYAAGVFPEFIDQLGLQLCMSPYWKRAYLRDKRNTHGQDTNFDMNKVTVDFAENVGIVGLPSMSGSNDVFLTPKKNMLYLSNPSKNRMPEMQASDRRVKVLYDWWEAIAFAYDEFVFAYVANTGGSQSGS
jgi:hypothetical protein